ncbi:hypothetical protein DAPPUDRAFT_322278 [Daphnia pulex]|uniref:Uncharacterized protein n=1 Tax=Daphnia pulex TaxID=6669 RepID=E9GVF8_DAPPU|nr:hypothetical protein DAPPUDRAFT_322278 [Daphnia pulex]|eukprot:EFX76540.1 hypothetical protein DAPPUDRAFT_322278 [Daphnia pulex]
MEASRQCSSFGSLKLFWILAAVLATGLSFEFPRQGRQRVEFIARTVTVAVTEVAFETIPTLCISLINATRPCVGRQAQWERIPAADLVEANVQPTVVQSLVTTVGPAMARLNDRDLELLKLDDRLLHSSLKEAPEESGRQQSSGFLYRFTNRFSNALGLVINGHYFFVNLEKFLYFNFLFGPDERLVLL